MKRSFISILRCPKCRSSLKAQTGSTEQEQIFLGLLECSRGHRYDITNGIPCFVKNPSQAERLTQGVFGEEWTRFGDYNACNFQKMSEDIHPNFFKDQTVLDAGCGAGRHLVALKDQWQAGQIVGIDLSDAVQTAYQRTSGIRDVHVARASIYEMPFEKDFFELIFCLGVLQHLPNPREAFSSLVLHLRPGGRILIWVYKSSLRKRFLEIPRFFTKKLTVKHQLRLSFLAASLLYPFVLLRKHCGLPLPSHFREYAKYDWHTYRTDWFDRLAAPLTGFYTENEVNQWFREEKLQDVQVTSFKDFFVRGIGTKKE